MAETIAIKGGIKIVMQHQISKHILGSDSQVSIHAITGTELRDV